MGFRVYIESLSKNDAQVMARIANDYEIAYNVAAFGQFPYPYKTEHAILFIDSAIAAEKNGREFHFGIHLNDDKRLIGAIGAISIEPIDRKCEVGYWLGKDYWGRGYAREAVSLILDMLFKRMNFNKVYARTFSFNTRSLALLESMGFRKEATLRQNRFHFNSFVDEEEFGMLRNEYKEINSEVINQ